MGVFLRRVVGAAGLRRSVFEEVAVDPVASIYAVFLIFLVGWSAYLGRLASQDLSFNVTLVLVGLLAGLPALVGCGITTLLVYLIGIRWVRRTSSDGATTLLPEPTVDEPGPDLGAVFRVVCFAQVPYLLGVFGGMPYVGIAFAVGLGVWGFFVWFTGLAALGIRTSRALIIWVISLLLVLWLVQ